MVQLVDEARRAWHAGNSFWAGERDINSRSIGIEIANPGHQLGYRPYPEIQIEAVIALCRDIIDRHPISPERVLGHSDVAPKRKEDPGELFPWRRLNSHGIGMWIPPTPIGGGPGARPDTLSLAKRFRQFGYRVDDNDELDRDMSSVVAAFQRHFRPARVDGVADWSTVDTLERLLAALNSGT